MTDFKPITAVELSRLCRSAFKAINEGRLPIDHKFMLDPTQPSSPVWTLKQMSDYFGMDHKYKRLETKVSRRIAFQAAGDDQEAQRQVILAQLEADKVAARLRSAAYRQRKLAEQGRTITKAEAWRRQLATVKPVAAAGTPMVDLLARLEKENKQD